MISGQKWKSNDQWTKVQANDGGIEIEKLQNAEKQPEKEHFQIL